MSTSARRRPRSGERRRRVSKLSDVSFMFDRIYPFTLIMRSENRIGNPRRGSLNSPNICPYGTNVAAYSHSPEGTLRAHPPRSFQQRSLPDFAGVA